MRLVIGQTNDPALLAWAASHIPHLPPSLGDFVGFGIVDDDGYLRGVALYHAYAPQYASIEITFALESPRYLSRKVIAGIMAYPFLQLNCQRVSAATPRRAKPARRFLKTFGFQLEGVGRRGFGPWGDAMAYSLLRGEYLASRWASPSLPTP